MFASGSLLWLMRHELRLWWRDLLSQPGGRTFAILISSGLFLGMGLWLLLELSGGAEAEIQELPHGALWIAVILWLEVFQVSFAQGISLCLVRIFERGDLDLLVSSPLPERVIFASRLLMVILRQILGFWWVWILLGMLTILLPQTLAALPTMLMLLISSTSLAMLVTLKLVQWIGAKQARAVAQIVSVGLSVVLLGVARLSDQGVATVWPGWEQVFGPQAPLGVNSWIWFPARAALGDLPSLGLSLLIGLGLAWGSVEVLHRSFIQGTQQVTTARHALPSAPQIHFRTFLPLLVIRKEWLLILRNPYLLSQIGLQLFSLVFLLFVLPESNLLEWLSGAQILAAVTCVVSSLLVSALAAICISGEEAPDLLRSAPVERAQIKRLKLLAVGKKTGRPARFPKPGRSLGLYLRAGLRERFVDLHMRFVDLHE